MTSTPMVLAMRASSILLSADQSFCHWCWWESDCFPPETSYCPLDSEWTPSLAFWRDPREGFPMVSLEVALNSGTLFSRHLLKSQFPPRSVWSDLGTSTWGNSQKQSTFCWPFTLRIEVLETLDRARVSQYFSFGRTAPRWTGPQTSAF